MRRGRPIHVPPQGPSVSDVAQMLVDLARKQDLDDYALKRVCDALGDRTADQEASLSELSAGVESLQKRILFDAMGMKAFTLSIPLLGGTQEVVVPLNRTLPDANYDVVPFASSSSLNIGNLTLSVKTKGVGSVTVTLKSSVASLSGAIVVAVIATRLANP